MTVLSNNRSLKTARIAGFSLLELMLAISMFLVIGGAAFMLFRQAVPIYSQQQNLASVNINIGSLTGKAAHGRLVDQDTGVG